MPTVADLETLLGIRFFDYQLDAFELWEGPVGDAQRMTLYYRTGAGKSITAMAMVALKGYSAAVVVAPPITRPAWVSLGERMGLTVEVVSHAKFRMKDFKLKRDVPLIADEFHLFGGHKGVGWRKLDRLAASLQAPLIACSATPNYNDAERVYCIQHVMDRHSCSGGYLEFLYQNCKTKQDPFSQTPKVTGFLYHKDAEHYLRSLPYVVHVPDNVKATIVDLPIKSSIPTEFWQYGLNRRSGRIMASRMEAKHAATYINRVGEDGLIRPEIYDELANLAGMATTPILLYCDRARIAEALKRTCDSWNVKSELLTGDTSPKQKKLVLDRFKAGELDVLIGTATLATGTDGLDKVCDVMVIVNDTDDDALRRQLVGRILPRGTDTDASAKQVYRLKEV